MTEPLQKQGVAIQSIGELKKLPPETLIDMLQESNRALQEEKRQGARREQDANSRVKMECDQLRKATATHTRELEEQNNTLLKSLTRLQAENDKLRQDIAKLEVKIELSSNGNNRGADTGAGGTHRPLVATEAIAHPGDRLSVSEPSTRLSGEALPPKLPATVATAEPVQVPPQTP